MQLLLWLNLDLSFFCFLFVCFCHYCCSSLTSAPFFVCLICLFLGFFGVFFFFLPFFVLCEHFLGFNFNLPLALYIVVPLPLLLLYIPSKYYNFFLWSYIYQGENIYHSCGSSFIPEESSFPLISFSSA